MAGKGRVVEDVHRYDISACDVYSMVYSFFVYDEKLHIMAIAFSPILHFLVCVSAMFMLSGILYILKPYTSQCVMGSDPSTNGKLCPEQQKHNRLLDTILVTTTFTVVVACALQMAYDNFVTVEDILLFSTAIVCFLFYVFSAFVTRTQMQGAVYESGVVIDALVNGLAVACVGLYSSAVHPFCSVTTALLIFRMWNKLLRISHGGAYVPSGAWGIPYIAMRFTLDSLHLCLTIVYGWNQSYNNAAVAGVSTVPLVLFAYLAAKYTFLSQTHMDTFRKQESETVS